LAEVDRPIAIAGFFTTNEDYQRETFQKLLDQYLPHSSYLS